MYIKSLVILSRHKLGLVEAGLQCTSKASGEVETGSQCTSKVLLFLHNLGLVEAGPQYA